MVFDTFFWYERITQWDRITTDYPQEGYKVVVVLLYFFIFNHKLNEE